MSNPALVETQSCALADLLRAQGLPPGPWTGLSPLNRQGTGLSPSYLTGQGIADPDRGFAWRPDDRKEKKWRPQGITLMAGDRAAVVSWYSRIKGKGNKGVRLSFVALAGNARYKYRHVLLVRPSNDGKLFEPVVCHAGGLAAIGNTIFVANSKVNEPGGAGILAFDASKIFPAVEDGSKKKCEFADGRAYAFNYRYILPLTTQYNMTMGGDNPKQTRNPRFSFCSIDWSDQTEPKLVTGNYHYRPRKPAYWFSKKYHNPPSKIVWWDLNGPKITGWGDRQIATGVSKAQGALSLSERIWISRGGRKPRLRTAALTGGENDYQDFGWPRGCEDLSYSPHSGDLWCLTEYRYKGDDDSKKYNRFVFSTKLGDYPLE